METLLRSRNTSCSASEKVPSSISTPRPLPAAMSARRSRSSSGLTGYQEIRSKKRSNHGEPGSKGAASA
jgi:hypothetical protein